MVLAHQFAIRALDLAFGGAALNAEDGVRILAGSRIARCLLRSFAAASGRCVGIALHCCERRQFAFVNAERPAQLAHDGEFARYQRAFGIDDIEQHIQQQISQIAAAMAPDLQIGNRQMRGETVLLARVEAFDCVRALRGRELHARHQIFDRSDFRFGYATVGFGDGAGQAEQRRHEGIRRGATGMLRAHRAAIPQMADRDADQDSERMTEQGKSNQGADELAQNIHRAPDSVDGCAAYQRSTWSSSAALSMAAAARMAATSRAPD